MATIAIAEPFDQLNNWPGRLLEDQSGTATVPLRTATQLVIRHGAGSEFQDYRIVVTGTGFSYVNGIPVNGTISQVRIVDDAGRTLVTLSGLSSNPIASDLSQFWSNVMGSPFDDAGPGPDGMSAWSQLLAGNDTINGTAGDDREYLPGFNAGNDVFNGGAGDDGFGGNIGNDTYNGGDGFDTLGYQETTFGAGGAAVRGATFNVDAGTVLDPWGGLDRFSGIEEFTGSRFDDVFNGSLAGDDRFRGLRGRDVIDGGDITFRNGVQTADDNDRVIYRDDYWQGGSFGIVADLETSVAGGSIRGTIRDGFGNVDRVIDIERVVGTRFNDSFTGSRVDNQFRGGEGRDTYNGDAGFDTLIFDDWFVEAEPDGIRVNLGLATGQILDDGFGNVETALGIEGINGTAQADVIAGNAAGNYFEGAGGGDIMTGRGGSDVFVWVEQDELGDGDRVTDFTAAGPQADRLAFEVENFAGMSTTLRLVNGTAATTGFGTFLFVNATDQLIWDSNGNGAGGQAVVAVLNNVNALSAASFELWD